MLKRKRTGWLLALFIGAAVLPTLSQQDEGPILRPRKSLVKPARATLLVICDLACNWKLDGEDKGRIKAGGSAKTKVERGQHFVIAMTEDGADQVKQLIEVKVNAQTALSIQLKPVRDARLKAEQEARDKSDQEARDKVAREEAAKPTWTDQTTGLMWTKKDNGSKVTWQEATEYCRNLQLVGHSDWRLPTIDELKSIYNENVNIGGNRVKGNLQLSIWWDWSSSQGEDSGEAWAFGLSDYGGVDSGLLGVSHNGRALCVRRSGR